jgi:N-acetylmuramoyl-L-alanine amidase
MQATDGLPRACENGRTKVGSEKMTPHIRLSLVVAMGMWLLAGCTPEQDKMVQTPYHLLDLSKSTNSKTKVDQPGPTNDWTPTAPARPWKYIVIHHSALDHGSAAAIDAAHRERGWKGLGYDFVIDNGNGGADGQVEVGYRWRQQEVGAHTGKTPGNAYNEFGIGICLIGDFTDHAPSPKQLAALNGLVRYLSQTYHISPQNIIGHRDAPGAHTECPGDVLYAYIYGTIRPSLGAKP